MAVIARVMGQIQSISERVCMIYIMNLFLYIYISISTHTWHILPQHHCLQDCAILCNFNILWDTHGELWLPFTFEPFGRQSMFFLGRKVKHWVEVWSGSCCRFFYGMLFLYSAYSSEFSSYVITRQLVFIRFGASRRRKIWPKWPKRSMTKHMSRLKRRSFWWWWVVVKRGFGHIDFRFFKTIFMLKKLYNLSIRNVTIRQLFVCLFVSIQIKLPNY